MDFTVYMHIYIVLLSLCNVLFLSTVECMKGRNLRAISGLRSRAVTRCWYSCFLGKCCSLVVKMKTAPKSLDSHVYKVFTSEEQQHWLWALMCVMSVSRSTLVTFTVFNGQTKNFFPHPTLCSCISVALRIGWETEDNCCRACGCFWGHSYILWFRPDSTTIL